MKKSRRGYSLVEMLVVIGVMSAVAGVAVGILHSILSVNHAARQGLIEQSALARLAETFRADARAADELTGGKSGKWELKRSDGPSVEYRLEADRLTRRGQTSAGGPTVEDFLLPKGAAVTIEKMNQKDVGGAAMLTLTVEPGTADDGRPRSATRGLRVEAQLGRDRRPMPMPTTTEKNAEAAQSQEETQP